MPIFGLSATLHKANVEREENAYHEEVVVTSAIVNNYRLDNRSILDLQQTKVVVHRVLKVIWLIITFTALRQQPAW